MKDKTGFYKTHYDSQRGWVMNNYPIEMLRGTKIKINNKEYNITPGFQKVITDKTFDNAKSMNDKEKLVFRDFLQKTEYFERIPTKGRESGRDKKNRNDLDNDVRRILN